MRENISIALRHVLAHEGGFVNHPKDPGGATNSGVTQKVYDAYRARQGQPPRSVRAITSAEVADIYKRQYWDTIRGDDLPSGLDYAVFDYAVNSGPRRAAMDLQRELGVSVDGIIGQMTLAAAANVDIFDLIERLCARRMRFLKGLRHWSTFGRGWTRRVEEVRVAAIQMALDPNEEKPEGAPSLPIGGSVEGKGIESERTSVTQSATLQATLVDLAAKGGAGIAALQAVDDRVVQLAIIGLLAIAVFASAIIFRERIKAWAEGWR